MKAKFLDEVMDIEDYLEEIGESREEITLDELEEMELTYWNYPISEVEHIIENGLTVVLVRFPELYGGYEYRWCELPKEE